MSKRGALVLLLVLILGALGLTKSGLPDRLLAVREIVVEGGERIPSETVLRLIDVQVGDNLLAVDLAALRARLVRHPWIASARVARRFPRLVVRLEERRPFVRVRLPGGERVWCDAAGYVLSGLERPEAGPLIQGLGPVQETPQGPRVGSQDDWQALRALVRRGGELTELVAVRLGPAGIEVDTREGLRVKLPLEGLSRALERWSALWPTLQGMGLQAVDLRLPAELVVRPG